MLLPALASVKSLAKTIPCASNMRNWTFATLMYLHDYDDQFPLFGESSLDYTGEFWHATLSPYIGHRKPPP
jgi:hypothetical protein